MSYFNHQLDQLSNDYGHLTGVLFSLIERETNAKNAFTLIGLILSTKSRVESILEYIESIRKHCEYIDTVSGSTYVIAVDTLRSALRNKTLNTFDLLMKNALRKDFDSCKRLLEETMKELQCGDKVQLMVFNKVDLVTDKHRIAFVKNKYNDSVIISAARGINILALKKKLNDLLQSSFVEEKVVLDIADSKTAAKIHSLAEVISTKYNNTKVHIVYKTNKENSAKIKKLVYGK